MSKIVQLPKLNSMEMLECDECSETALNLFFSKSGEFDCLAYKCISCNYVGYFHIEHGGEEE